MPQRHPPAGRRRTGQASSGACSDVSWVAASTERERTDERPGGGQVSMSAIDGLLANNAAFASSTPVAQLEGAPSLGLAVVTCMDCRVNVMAALGLGDGEAHIVRNAGGVITDDVIRSLAISQRRLG